MLRYLIRVGFVSRKTALRMGLCYPLGLCMPLIRSVRGDEAWRRICSPLTCLTTVQPNMSRSAREKIGLNQECNTKSSKCIPGHLHSPITNKLICFFNLNHFMSDPLYGHTQSDLTVQSSRNLPKIRRNRQPPFYCIIMTSTLNGDSRSSQRVSRPKYLLHYTASHPKRQ